MNDFITIDPRTHQIEVVPAPDFAAACEGSSLTDACVVYDEPADKVTAFFLDSGLPFGITAPSVGRALAAVVTRQDACRVADHRMTGAGA